MAYQVVDSFRTVETFGGLDSRDVQRVIVRALPSGFTPHSYVPNFAALGFLGPNTEVRAKIAPATMMAKTSKTAIGMNASTF